MRAPGDTGRVRSMDEWGHTRWLSTLPEAWRIWLPVVQGKIAVRDEGTIDSLVRPDRDIRRGHSGVSAVPDWQPGDGLTNFEIEVINRAEIFVRWIFRRYFRGVNGGPG